MKTALVAAALVGSLAAAVHAAEVPRDLLDGCNVSWDSPGSSSLDSMPLGNGDIGLNVWVEKTGDLVFYISKTDAWSDNVGGNKGLLKLGRIRVKIDPPFDVAKDFRQRLNLHDGMIQIENHESQIQIWVDANHPVVHVESENAKNFGLSASFETLRPVPEKDLQADTVLDGQKNRVAWFYRNKNTRIPQLTNRTFGAIMQGDDLVPEGCTTLKSSKAATKQALSIHVLTAQTATPEEWLAQLEKQIASTDAVKMESAREQHRAWWNEFWNRSWIFASGDDDAKKVTQGYVLQRFVSACAGRGAQPIKFNGSIFTMDWVKREKKNGVETVVTNNADTRDWGGQYWFQNTRPMYWPMLQSGDFDMMKPLFGMFRAILPDNEKDVRDFYHHDGAYFAETKPFWGGINKLTPESPGKYTDFYYTPILELSAMMLDYFAYTGDRDFARETLLPVADSGMKFFDQHWKRENGKLPLDPDNAIEMFWKARNPAPDIAGLRFDLQGLLALPDDITTDEQRSRWKRFLAEIPELPTGETNGVKILKPAEVYDHGHNFENPELYSVFPFRLFGLGKPDIELARKTFAVRRFRTNGCWRQDGVQAALLGEAGTARTNVTFVLTRKDKQCRFPAFWDHGSDYVPDEDNGGNGVNALQLMLMQSEGRKILLLPAWPKNWDCDFKLHVPMQTTVEGKVRGGKIKSLEVIPESRRKDVDVVEGS